MTKVQIPGEVLKSFIDEFDYNPSKLAGAIKANQATIRLVTLNKAKITVPLALRLAKFFGNKVEFWIELQTQYDLFEAAQDKELGDILKSIDKVKKPAAKPAAKPAGPAKKAAKPGASKPPAAKKAPAKAAKKPKPAPKPGV
jgi:addiction module HigA family antidote